MAQISYQDQRKPNTQMATRQYNSLADRVNVQQYKAFVLADNRESTKRLMQNQHNILD
jgi:hypothetical protein